MLKFYILSRRALQTWNKQQFIFFTQQIIIQEGHFQPLETKFENVLFDFALLKLNLNSSVVKIQFTRNSVQFKYSIQLSLNNFKQINWLLNYSKIQKFTFNKLLLKIINANFNDGFVIHILMAQTSALTNPCRC